jgi:hypothetical protein
MASCGQVVIHAQMDVQCVCSVTNIAKTRQGCYSTDSTRSTWGKNCRTVPSTQPCNVLGKSGQPLHAPPKRTFKILPSNETISTEPP